MTPARPHPDEDRVRYFMRLTLYATCIVLPFVGLLVGVTTGERALTAAVTLLSAVGPMVALSRTTTEKQVERQAYAYGLEDGLERDEPPHGRHRLDEGQQ